MGTVILTSEMGQRISNSE